MDRVGYSAIGKKEILLSAVWVRSQYREERLLASQCLSVCLSVYSHWPSRNFHEI